MNIADYLSKDLFRGKSVFVTGGSSGINLGIAKSFAALGAGVGICGRTAEKLASAAVALRELGAQVVAEVADVRDYSAVERALRGTCEQFGPIDVLVCGAAGNFPIAAERLSPNGFKSWISTCSVRFTLVAQPSSSYARREGASCSSRREWPTCRIPIRSMSGLPRLAWTI